MFYVTDRATSKLVEVDPDCINRILALRNDSSFPVTQSKRHQQSTSFNTLISDKSVCYFHSCRAGLPVCSIYIPSRCIVSVVTSLYPITVLSFKKCQKSKCQPATLFPKFTLCQTFLYLLEPFEKKLRSLPEYFSYLLRTALLRGRITPYHRHLISTACSRFPRCHLFYS